MGGCSNIADPNRADSCDFFFGFHRFRTVRCRSSRAPARRLGLPSNVPPQMKRLSRESAWCVFARRRQPGNDCLRLIFRWAFWRQQTFRGWRGAPLDLREFPKVRASRCRLHRGGRRRDSVAGPFFSRHVRYSLGDSLHFASGFGGRLAFVRLGVASHRDHHIAYARFTRDDIRDEKGALLVDAYGKFGRTLFF